jgi:pimeloyl-ACP methyl ester carboxylesterase
LTAAGLFLVALAALVLQLPSLGAGGLLHPGRSSIVGPAPTACQTATFAGDGVTLKGWRCPASGLRRGALIYLHGVADNRASASGLVDRFGKRGFEVVAYDSRAHGESDGEACTYGFFEKRDLSRVLDSVTSGPVVVIGTSLGAAVALQTAAEDARVNAVVAAEVFSDLRTVVRDRAPFFFTSGVIERAMLIAEERGRFKANSVSPELAARNIHVPVLLIHGAADVHTTPDHSRRVYAALRGVKRLIIVPGARHNESLRGEVWTEIERWIDEVVSLEPARLREDAQVVGARLTAGTAVPVFLTISVSVGRHAERGG